MARFLWRRRCDALCTSAYTNDVILTDNGRIGGISELTYYTHYYLFRTQSKKTLRSVSRLVARAGLTEYCQWERLDIACSRPDEVVVMTRAYYGRMQYGRCIRRDYGYVGCYADVRALADGRCCVTHRGVAPGRDARALADGRCSGRRSCRISVPDQLFDGTTPCPDDLTQ